MRSIVSAVLTFFSHLFLIFTRNKIRVLAFHKVDNTVLFEKKIAYLKSRYNIISLNEFKDFIFNGKKLPSKALLLTFDDGDYSLYTNALPILKKYNTAITLFIITGLIDTNLPFWWDEIRYYFPKSEWLKQVAAVKKLSDKSRIEFINNLRKNSDKPIFNYRQLTTSELKELNAAGVSIANHSHTHPMFDKCELDQMKNELILSSSFLKKLNFDSDIFAYPNGNYSVESEQSIIDNGIKVCFLFDHKMNSQKINPLRVSRIKVSDTQSASEFISKVAGFHSFLFHLKKRLS